VLSQKFLQIAYVSGQQAVPVVIEINCNVNRFGIVCSASARAREVDPSTYLQHTAIGYYYRASRADSNNSDAWFDFGVKFLDYSPWYLQPDFIEWRRSFYHPKPDPGTLTFSSYEYTNLQLPASLDHAVLLDTEVTICTNIGSVENPNIVCSTYPLVMHCPSTIMVRRDSLDANILSFAFGNNVPTAVGDSPACDPDYIGQPQATYDYMLASPARNRPWDVFIADPEPEPPVPPEPPPDPEPEAEPDTVPAVLDLIERELCDSQFWSREELLGHLNDALTEWQLLTWDNTLEEEAVNVEVDPIHNVYAVPDRFLAPLGVRYGHYGHSLRRTTVEELDRECQWEDPLDKRLNPREWAPIGVEKFLIHPKPLSDGYVSVTGVDRHELLRDEPGATIPIRREHVPALVDWVVNRAAYKLGGQVLYSYAHKYDAFLLAANRVKKIDLEKLRPKVPKGVVDDAGLREGAERREALE